MRRIIIVTVAALLALAAFSVIATARPASSASTGTRSTSTHLPPRDGSSCKGGHAFYFRRGADGLFSEYPTHKLTGKWSGSPTTADGGFNGRAVVRGLAKNIVICPQSYVWSYHANPSTNWNQVGKRYHFKGGRNRSVKKWHNPSGYTVEIYVYGRYRR